VSTLVMQWVLLPASVKLALWIALGAGLAALMWRLLPGTRLRKIVPAAYLFLHAVSPYAYSSIRGVWAEYQANKEAWLAATCREIAGAASATATRPLEVEGFLITANYDRLTNKRFQRVAALERGNSGDGMTVVDTGKYPPHPIYSAVPGGTFAKMAHALLAQKRFSYVEFEMLPDGWDKGYSNAGGLNTSGWSGKRYRRYYLAPGGDRNCVSESGEAPQVSGGVFLGSVHESLAQARPQTKPVCLALEIADVPLSKHRLAADEPLERLRGEIQVRGITIPVSTTVRGDRLQVASESGEVYRYFGFDYPNELSPKYRCQSAQGAAAIVGGVLAVDASRAFYRKKGGYEGSAVQAFFEPDKVQVAAVEAKPEARAPAGETSCPARARGGDSRVVANQLEDFASGRGTSIESKVGGSQPASLFSLSRDSSVTALAWSGIAGSGGDKQTFLVRIFTDADGVPGAMSREFEIEASARATGKWSFQRTSIFEARPKDLNLAAGDYWLSVLTAKSAQANFYWAFEPEGERPQCGSGGVIRHYDGGKWGGEDSGTAAGTGYALAFGNLPAPVAKPRIVHRTARGFSFRLEVK